MQNLFCRAIACLFMLTFLSCQTGHCAEQDPVKFIIEFYTWYISVPSSIDATKSKDIYRYIARNTVDEINKTRPGTPAYDYDYFLKTSNPPSSMSGVDILVNEAVSVSTNTFIAIVEFKIKHRKYNLDKVIVILNKSKGHFKIVKCLDTYPEA